MKIVTQATNQFVNLKNIPVNALPQTIILTHNSVCFVKKRVVE